MPSITATPWLAGWCGRTLLLFPMLCAATSSFAGVPLAAAAEGKRQRVLLFQSGQRTVLEADCPSASAFTARSGYLAFQCARERAADEELHGTLVFDPGARKLGEIAHCRSPTWAPGGIACEAESVDAEGRLKLQRKTISFESLKRNVGTTPQP